MTACAAHADRLKEIKERGKLICGTQSTSVPYAYQDQNSRTFVGYDVDMCKALAKGLGVELDHRPLSTEARIPELKLGRVDVVAGSMAYLPERAQQVDYSLQYLRGEIKVLVRESAGIANLAGLAGKRVCASKGSSSAAIAERVLTNSRVVSFQDVAACNLALQTGRVDAFTAGELVLKRFLNASEASAEHYTLLQEPTAVEHIGLVVDKGTPELLTAINGVIRKMDADGELDAIFNRWMGKDTVYGLSRNFKVEPVGPAQ
ncbi:transporter substrate-binding domain-containing protein [Bradyrhizobium sp. ISRA443]|uniref:transporter substrate-binding domain-containing protein n=1 Tax=unclassified Bradyrhizobium TaxID=2631580 RepID=UPI002479DD84|nr:MULTISPECIES: transporter substrate-binding domain-containing protein [unclassified Bradyrhizobium]WGR94501.1 transporter substrate-binding domain-containing protein [Bradyrhizobium sp. ISRA435]WGR99248.1 transporter substrate-binding domain-containing protein [Bradyrhizobium sp. ISRA436]WGS06140.1 transporter substrate-binding domain-containing protein [Bradyrhizobium sp. ISRA437]WGS13025.1 transporter substrate-binding domain-containing protein [Bradyrhizobium sp. ISRA443]